MVAMSGIGPTRKLADGQEIPVLGLGVWQVPDGQECEDAVRFALQLGYRHIDTAQAYGNEASVGRALAESGVPREQVWITTKFYPGATDPLVNVRESLERLQTSYVDLYIIHWPQGGATWAWPGMEAAKDHGHARSIGVSNFNVRELDELAKAARIAPAVNQVQFSPFEYRRGLQARCEQAGIALEAYSPLGTGRHLSAPIVAEIAAATGRTPAQVLLRWCLQRNAIVIPKSTHFERIKENGALFDFELSERELATLDALDETGGTAQAREQTWW